MERDANLVRRHEGQFEKIENRLSALEGTMARHDALLIRLDADVYNHGQEGMKTVLSNFITKIETEREKDKDQRNSEHQSNSMKLNVLMLIATACLVFIGGIGLFITYETSKHSQLDPAKLFHSQSQEPRLSYWHKQQSTSIPTLR